MSAPDHGTVSAIEKRMKEAAKTLHDMEPEIATAMTVMEYDSDRRKNLLAKYALKHINEGDSATAAETKARADAEYDKEFQQLFSQYEMAQATRKRYDAYHVSWETGRSLLARQRETIRTLPETEA